MRYKFAGSVLLLLFSAGATVAQPAFEKAKAEWYSKIAAAKSDTARAFACNKLGTLFYDNRKTQPNALDSALHWQRLAEEAGSADISSRGYKAAMFALSVLYLYKSEHALAGKKLLHTNDSARSQIYGFVARLYSESDKTRRANPDSTIQFAKLALETLKQVYNPVNEIWCLTALVNTYYANSRHQEGRPYVEQLDAIYAKQKNLKKQADMWFTTAMKLPIISTNYNEALYCINKAWKIFQQIKDYEQIANLHIILTDIYTENGKTDLALSAIQTAENTLLQHGINTVHKVYARYYDIYRMQGDFEKALFYVLKSVEIKETTNREHMYSRLGITYYELGELGNAAAAFQKGDKIARDSGKIIVGSLVKWYCKVLLAQHKPNEAFAYIKKIENEFFYQYDQDDKVNLFEAYGDCYDAFGQFEKAEVYYSKMKDAAGSLGLTWQMVSQLALGRFYYRNKHYSEAKSLLHEVMNRRQNVSANVQAEIFYMMYKADSANLNYLSALNHLNRYKQISDTIFSTKKTRLIAEINTLYEVEKKNNELLIKDQSIKNSEKEIALLTQQSLLQKLEDEKRQRDILFKENSIHLLRSEAELQKALALSQENSLQLNNKTISLNEQNILLLKRKADLQSSKLEQAALEKKITIGGLIVALIISGLLYNQYRIKRNSNRKISEKNMVLAGLVEEKEWLVKEVHHRVKNHLQIMQSLLESQAAYLTDDALAAVQVSQQRVQAMSLIHQKLYQAGNNDDIDMKVYITELTAYLKDSFAGRKKITVSLSIEPLTLDMTQAVPLGLIINEAITNSYKHAFANQDMGDLRIILQQADAPVYRLEVNDTGAGLPANFDIDKNDSLGFKLMKGLSEQIHGNLIIDGERGTNISVEFKALRHERTYLRAI